MDYKTLNNGVKIPMLGFGVFRMNNQEAEQAVCDALHAGFRYIDTANMYQNEEGVGKALVKSMIPREELFISSKLGVLDTNFEGAKKGFETSLEKLGLEYIDLYIIHQPFNDYYGAWRALSELYEEGKIRAIGVDNFTESRLADFLAFNTIKPAVNYLEIHPYNQQSNEIKYLKSEGVSPVAWSPFAAGQFNILNDSILSNIASEHGKTTAQIVLRWLIQNKIPTVVKSSKIGRMEENLAIFDFELSEREMIEIENLNINKTLGGIRTSAKQVNDFLKMITSEDKK
ncbi:aldo/keto reductase [Lactococcus lactis]|nr:aldo/keto reductase [Lactococcus lactis]ARE13519.2 aldo/keto reductase [Lactococcus lactis subsp. lactis]ARE15931.1 aldo/keto reductase [Lactococcus lactis subsp. lactis]